MQTAPDQLNFDDDWLMFFPDETGHETFAGDQPYFAVGGCVMLGAHHGAISAAPSTAIATRRFMPPILLQGRKLRCLVAILSVTGVCPF
jgi:hypothetical protein